MQTATAAPKSQRTTITELEAAIDRGLEAMFSKQAEDGAWKGDYGGPMFLLPMFVGTHYITGRGLDGEQQQEVIRYILNHQNDDGGFGLHIEGESHVFTTVGNYVALRLLGESPDRPEVARARSWMHANGGALYAASWGKFLLALLNLYDWRGIVPVQPELWLLPKSLPIHPGRLWCHARMVYLPMSYLYGHRLQAPLDPLLAELREELYNQPYDSIDWEKGLEACAMTDSYTPRSQLSKTATRVLLAYEKRPNRRLRQRSLDFVRDQVRQEDENTNFICIGPVSKIFHTLIAYWEDPNGEAFRRHAERLSDYLWAGDDGIRMQGYNSSELWDTTFAVQAVVATERTDEHRAGLARAHDFIDQQQVLEDVPAREKYFRCPSKGGWPFSTRPHGWPITDCTAEGIKSSLLLEHKVPTPISEARLTDAVDLLLWWQNKDGGWASYERTRGPAWLELLNPSDCFGGIMIDYPYPECSSAAIQALAAYQRRYPGRRDREIRTSIRRGAEYLEREQRADGSWYGSWGICFTYGTWFGVSGLRAAGLPENHERIRRACDFLESKQLDDGGWGETAESSRSQTYSSTVTGQAVMSSWAMLTLAQGGPRYLPALSRGARFLIDRQTNQGTWPAEHIAGMFNRTCAIHYDNYLKLFPLWALAKARRAVG